MTLVEAFEKLSMLVPGDLTGNAERETAARIIKSFLEERAPGISTRSEVFDAVQVTLFRLLRSGTRPTGLSEPQVEAYLWRALSRNLTSEFRPTRPGPLPEDEGRMQRLRPGPDQAVLDETAGFRLTFHERVAVTAAEAIHAEQPREDFLQDIEDMRQLAFGEISLADLSYRRKRLPNALHARHMRARERLLTAIEALGAKGEISADQTDQFEAYVRGFLRRRQ